MTGYSAHVSGRAFQDEGCGVSEEEDLLEDKLVKAAAKYAKFLCVCKDLNRDEALIYVNEILKIRDSIALHRGVDSSGASSGRNKVKDNKSDNSYPSQKGDSLPAPPKDRSSDDANVLHKCELSSQVNRAKAYRRKQRDERGKLSPLAALADLEGNITNQIDTLYRKLLFAKTSYEMDIISSSIETIIQKKKAANDLLSMFIPTVKSD